MPLSDNEQRLLEQMERAISAEDPKFASAMRGSARRPGSGRRLIIGVGGVALGLVLLIVGVAKSLILLGVLGFISMLAGTVYAVSGHRPTGPTGIVGPGGVVRNRRSKTSFMRRMEERWDRRRDDR